jgi:anthranilate phosphoribosyltransferase
MINESTAILASGKNLRHDQMKAVMEEILSGSASTGDIVAFLKALNMQGETVEELTAAVEVMRGHATRIHARNSIVLDTCGTGGDSKGTFNISTAVAIIASACGITVAKHGNRAVSSSCGSADILEALGINLNLSPEKLSKCLDEIGIAFLFAQNLHPAMKYAMPARKVIGKRTIFNILGPLSNPAQATHQLVGVFDISLTKIIAEALKNLGSVHALVVHGEGGLDEATTTGKTHVCEAYKGRIKSYDITPEEFGLARTSLEDLKGGDCMENASTLIGILQGEEGAKQDIVLLNAGCAIYAADKAGSIKEGIDLARGAVKSGKAMRKLELLKEFTLKNA